MGVRYWLSDRGIRQAIERGLIRFDPQLEDHQFQPASIDVLFDALIENFPMDNFPAPDSFPVSLCEILPQCEVELRTRQAAHWNPYFKIHTELRSTLRRLGCMVQHGITFRGPEDRQHVLLNNPGSITIELSPGDKISQLLFKFEEPSDVSFKKHELPYREEAVDSYYRMMELDKGGQVHSNQTAVKLLREGYFSVSPGAKFEKGMLAVHAGTTARVLRRPVHVVLCQKTDIAGAFETVRLPYRLMPGEHIDVDVNEHLKLSKHIGIQFCDYVLGTSRGFSPRTLEQRLLADAWLSDMPDGWVDPGYKGAFSRQPKTLFSEGVVINPGDVLGHGIIVFYPNGVERPYGSAGLGSHYQNAAKTKFTQK